MINKPNIILFITHDQGKFLNCYNSTDTPNNLKTPNVDKIAKKGIKFNNYFCTAPQCSPSRGSIKTSLYPHQNGLMGLVNLGWTLPESNKTLAIYLKENGYTTHLLGLQHESLNANSLGYDTISKRGPEFKYSRNRMEKDYIKFLNEHQKDQKPFYLNIGTIEVHRPFKAWSKSVDPTQVIVPHYLPDIEDVRNDLADFYGNVEVVDQTIGLLIDILEDLEMMENTLFIYTTDHGIPFPRAKCTLYDPGLRTSLIMYHKNSKEFTGGKTINSLLSNIDLLPSLLDYTGAEIPDEIEGISFLPILRNQIKKGRSEIYAEKTFHEIYDPIRGIRTSKYKYIKNFEKLGTLYQIPADILRDPSGQVMKEKYKVTRPKEELYDLTVDPFEENNLIENYEYNNILIEMRKKLNAWMIETKDPLLEGKVIDRRQKVQKHY
ncbi:MAG: sulfatase [Candidatus Lokiarchaeota archaeon]